MSLPAPTLALAGLAAGAAGSLVGRPGAAVLIALAAVGLIGRDRLLVLAVVSGMAVGAWRIEQLAVDPLAGRVGTAVDLIVTIEEPWRASARSARAAATVHGGGRVQLRLPTGLARPPRGSRVRVAGTLVRPRADVAGFRERAWLAHRGIHVVLPVGEVLLVGRRGGVRGAIDRVRVSALDAFVAAGNDDAGRLLGAIALGADDELSPAARDAFRASGLAHLLAVSGGNVALLVAALLVAVWACGGSRLHGQVAAIGAVTAYVAIVGPSPSVVRAGVAGVLMSAAWLASRPADPWHLYVAGLAVLLCHNPWNLLDAGFQLSFAAVAAILVVAPRFRRALDGVPFPGVLRTPAALSAACTLATAPIGWWHFGQLNLVASVPANLLALPAVPLLLWTGLASGMAAPFAPGAAAGLAAAGRVPGEYLLAVAYAGEAVDARTRALELPLAVALAVLLGYALLRWSRHAIRSRMPARS